jgi:hypothetical protein
MRRTILMGIALAATAAYAAAPGVVASGTESKWSVTTNGKPVATMTLLTSATAARAEWKPAGGKASATTVYLADGSRIWLRGTGGDTDLATISANPTEHAAAAALLASGRPSSATVRGSAVTYTSDAKGATKIVLGATTLTRTSLTSSTADASNFIIKPKSQAGTRLAGLTNLLGASDSSVSATAGSRGVGTKGLKLADGGNYDAVARLEARDEKYHANIDKALADFQKAGKVGKERENQ